MQHERSWFDRNRLDIALFVFGLALVAPWVHLVTAQVASRYAFSAAIVEEHTAWLDSYTGILGIDQVEIDGHVYSDKAPGQPVLAVPAVAMGELLGAEPATVSRFRGNLGVWPPTFASAMVPFALLLVLMRRHARRHVSGGLALVASLAVGCSTLLLPMGADLYSHVLSGLFALAAWHLLSRSTPSPRVVVLAGACAGAAVSVEYPLLGVAGLLGLVLLVQRRWADAARYAAACAPFVAAVSAYHWVLLGDPTASPYTLKDGGRLHLLTLPGIHNTIDVFFGARGFVFTPIVLLGIVGIALHGVWCDAARTERLVVAAVIGGFLFLQIGWNDPWTGDSPGPRLVTPALPFLVVPVALMMRRVGHRVTAGLIGLGVVSMVLALVTLQLLPGGAALIVGHLDNIADDRIGLAATLFTLALGPAGWLVHAAVVVAAGAWLGREAGWFRARRHGEPSAARPADVGA